MSVRGNILQRLHVVSLRSTEDIALAALARRSVDLDAGALMSRQLSSGAWGASPGVEVPNAFQTALATLALRSGRDPSAVAIAAARRGLEWLFALEPAEVHWLWKWKFRFFDRQVRFDPNKYGWPWVEGTVSWVAPTALTMLAFEAWQFKTSRMEMATAMLLDRACLGGGWNAGNSVVFGVSLDPHPDFTAMALLALRERIPSRSEPIRAALEYLANRLTSSRSTYSLSWGVMALGAYGDLHAEQLRHQLESVLTGSHVDSLPPRILALAALALEEPPFTFREVPI